MMSQTVPVVHGAARGGSAGRRAAGAVLAFAVIAVVFVELLPRIANYGDVWSVLTTLGPAQVAALAIATAINLATFAPPWMAAIPGLGYWNATVLTQVSTALSIAVPGGDAAGIAASYAMLRRWGIGRRAVAVAVVVTGVGNQLVNVLLPLLALALLVMTGGSSPVLLTAALIGIAAILAVSAAFALVLRGSGRRSRWAGGRSGWSTTCSRLSTARRGRDGARGSSASAARPSTSSRGDGRRSPARSSLGTSPSSLSSWWHYA